MCFMEGQGVDGHVGDDFSGTHGNVLNAHTGTFSMHTRGFSACHTTPTTHTHTNNRQTTTHHTHNRVEVGSDRFV